jgi:hypothetical protein
VLLFLNMESFNHINEKALFVYDLKGFSISMSLHLVLIGHELQLCAQLLSVMSFFFLMFFLILYANILMSAPNSATLSKIVKTVDRSFGIFIPPCLPNNS